MRLLMLDVLAKQLQLFPVCQLACCKHCKPRRVESSIVIFDRLQTTEACSADPSPGCRGMQEHL